jgi:phage tail-like protein
MTTISVEWEGFRAVFSEAIGLAHDTQSGESPRREFRELSALKMPGLRRFTNITLKRGVATGDNDFFRWLSSVRLKTGERRDLVVTLLNEERQPVMVWKVRQAIPVKVEGPELTASGNEVAIESVELAHEGLEVQSG